jgi:hypothetical protein
MKEKGTMSFLFIKETGQLYRWAVGQTYLKVHHEYSLMKICLKLITALVSLTAIAGGLLLILDPGGGSLHLSASMLHNTVFRNYLLPGILLVVLVGGINGIALASQFFHSKNSYSWTVAGAIVLWGWTFIQMLMFNGTSWLQILYLFIGLFMILLTWQLKGIWAA